MTRSDLALVEDLSSSDDGSGDDDLEQDLADVGDDLVERVRAVVADRDQLRAALAVVRVKAATADRQPHAVLQWIGRYCAIASIPTPCSRSAKASDPTDDDPTVEDLDEGDS